MNFRMADWEGFTAETGEICWNTSANLLLCWEKKSSSISSAMPENTTSPAVMLGITAALRCCVTPHILERSAPHRWPPWPCHQATALGHPAAHRDLSSAQLSSTTLCWTVQFPSQVRQDILHRGFHSAGLCSQRRGGRGKPTMLLFDQVGRWQATGHCSLEIQRDTVHFWHPPVLTLPSSANWRCGGPLNRTHKILSVVLDTRFTFSPHACDCVEQA